MGRSDMLVGAGMLLATIAAMPVIGGSLFTIWRAQALGELPPFEDNEGIVIRPVAEVRELPPAPPRPPVRDVDRAVLRLVETPVEGQRAVDVTASQPFQVDLVREGEGKGMLPTGAEIDLDRDGLWDEVWTFDPIERLVSPEDDGLMRLRFRWSGGEWVPAGEPDGREPPPDGREAPDGVEVPAPPG